MDKEFSRAAEHYSSELARRIEQAFPDCRIRDMGWLIVVSLQNKSVFTLNVLSADKVDVAGEDCTGQHWNLAGASWEQALNTLQQVNGLTTNEETATDAVAGYNTPGAFARPGQKSNRAIQASEREGWERIETNSQRWITPTESWWQGRYPIGSASASLAESSERDQTGRKRVSPIGFTDDPLGADRTETRPNKRSEGRRASQIRHNYSGGSPLALSEADNTNETGSAMASGSISENETPQTLTHLASVLPVDSAEIDGNNLMLAVADANILITAKPNGNFEVQSFVDGEPVQENDNVAAGDLIRWSFTICDRIRDLAAEWGDKHKEKSEYYPANDQVPPSDVWEVLNELARETGKPTDPIRNKALFDLRQGLVGNPNSISGRRFFGGDFASGTAPDAEITSSLRGGTTHGGHPVSLNESRDITRPYQNTTGGKKLVYVQGQGAVFVDANKIPPKKKLNWNPEHGVILTEETEPTNRRHMWKYPNR